MDVLLSEELELTDAVGLKVSLELVESLVLAEGERLDTSDPSSDVGDGDDDDNRVREPLRVRDADG